MVELLDFEDLPPTESRRRDYKQLLILVKALRQFRSNNVRPNITIPNAPSSISNARWNSRALYSLYAEITGLDDINNFEVSTFIHKAIFVL